MARLDSDTRGVIFTGAAVAFALGTVQILTRRANQDTPQPFGPYLVATVVA
ncbi:hypothetical protein T35B1_18308 [Salinisphaera shabanensis T35B1]